jgi:hypothetical protein
MSSFIAIVLVDVNIIAIYELWKSSEFVYYQITQLSEQKYRLAIPFAEHNFGPFRRNFVIGLFQSISKFYDKRIKPICSHNPKLWWKQIKKVVGTKQDSVSIIDPETDNPLSAKDRW